MPNERRINSSTVMEALVREFGAPLKRFFVRRLEGSADADDLVQEVFERLLHRDGIEKLEGLKGYVFSTAENLLRDRARYRAVRHAGQHRPFEENDDVSSAISPEHVLENKQALQRIVAALEALSPTTRAVFIFCMVEGYTHDEVADELEMTSRNVRKHLKKAQDFLLAKGRENW